MAENGSADVAGIVDRYHGDPSMIVPIMLDVQAECGYLPQPELKELSSQLAVPLSRVYSVAAFYDSFRLMPQGDHTIELCVGTACFQNGAREISEAIQEEFSLVPNGTTEDGRFTYCPANCVGACSLAPVMVVDGEYLGGLTPETAVDVLHRIASGERPVVPATQAVQFTTEPGAAKKPKPKKKAKKKKKGGSKKT